MELDKVEQSGTKQLVAAAIAIIAPQARRKPLERCALDEPADIRVGATPIRRLIDGPAEAHRKWQAPHLADATAARFMAVFVGTNVSGRCSEGEASIKFYSANKLSSSERHNSNEELNHRRLI